jgi:hypothetical protein
MTCKGTLRHVFIRVYRLEIAKFLSTLSHVGIFNPALGSVLSFAPLPFPPVQLSLLPFSLHVYTNTVCKGGGVWVSEPLTGKHLPQSPFTGKFF